MNLIKTLLAPEWESLPESERRLRLVVSWSKEELPLYIKTWGIDEWIDKYYLRPNWIAVIEYGLFTVAVILMIQSLI